MGSEQGAQRSSHWGEFRAQWKHAGYKMSVPTRSWKEHFTWIFGKRWKVGSKSPLFMCLSWDPHTHSHFIHMRLHHESWPSYMVGFPGNPRISDAVESLSTLLFYLTVCWLHSMGVKPEDYGGQLPVLDLKMYVMTVPKSRLGLGPSHNPKAATGK